MKPCPTPMTVGKLPLERSQEKGKEQMGNPTLYSPTMIDWQVVERVLQYLKETLDYSIHLKPSKSLCLIAYSDADWGSCPLDRKSVSDVCVYFGDSLISWSS